jgi:hypothetical protein
MKRPERGQTDSHKHACSCDKHAVLGGGIMAASQVCQKDRESHFESSITTDLKSHGARVKQQKHCRLCFIDDVLKRQS